MTNNDPCTYCGEHHHYQHELVCDNVRTLYPLWDNKAEQKEAAQIAETYFQDEIKALKNDYMILNTYTTDLKKDVLQKSMRIHELENREQRVKRKSRN